jgi:hypothetical protein
MPVYSYMKKILKKTLTSKKGVTINAGERVEIRFDVKGNDGIREHNPFLASYVSLNTEDGRRIVTRNLRVAGLKIPSQRKLEHWSFDSVAKSVFGTDVEPDGWSYDGSPSWLLALGLI